MQCVLVWAKVFSGLESLRIDRWLTLLAPMLGAEQTTIGIVVKERLQVQGLAGRVSYLPPGVTVAQAVALLGTLSFSHTCVVPAGICTARIALNETIAILPDTPEPARTAATVVYERGPDAWAPHSRLAVGLLEAYGRH